MKMKKLVLMRGASDPKFFSLSQKAILIYEKLSKMELHHYTDDFDNKDSKGNHKYRKVTKDENWEKLPIVFHLTKDAGTNPNQDELSSAYYKHSWESNKLKRDDPILVQVVEECGDFSFRSFFHQPVLVEIPENAEFEIFDPEDEDESYNTDLGEGLKVSLKEPGHIVLKGIRRLK